MAKFYLVGGTALALHIGHRRSVGFDFFSREAFVNLNIISHLRTIGQFELFEQARNTIHGSLDGVKISFLLYNYPLAKPLHPFMT